MKNENTYILNKQHFYTVQKPWSSVYRPPLGNICYNPEKKGEKEEITFILRKMIE